MRPLIAVLALIVFGAWAVSACGGDDDSGSGDDDPAAIDSESIQEGLEAAGYGVFEGEGAISYETSEGTLSSSSSLDVTEAEKSDANLAVFYEFADEEEADRAAEAAEAEGSTPEVLGAFLVLAEESERAAILEAAGGG